MSPHAYQDDTLSEHIDGRNMVVQIGFEYSDKLFEWKHKDFYLEIPDVFSLSSFSTSLRFNHPDKSTIDTQEKARDEIIFYNILCQIDRSKLIFCRVSVDKYFD